MKIPHPLNTKEQYLYAIATKLDEVIELLSKKDEHEEKPVNKKEEQKEKPAPRKARAKKEA